MPATLEEEKKAAPAKPKQARRTKPKPARVTKPKQAAEDAKPKQAEDANKLEYKYRELFFSKWMDNKARFDLLGRQGVYYNAQEKYFSCINCEMELNFTDSDKALVHCNRERHQINRFHRLEQRQNLECECPLSRHQK